MREEQSGATQSIARCFAVLECVAAMEGGAALRELAARVGLPKSTVHRLLGDLMALGYVRQEGEGGPYRLTARMFEVGSASIGRMDLVTLARPHLERLAGELRETVHLVVRDGSDVVYVYKAEAGDLRLSSRLGLRAPMYCTGVGKAILATLPYTAAEQALAAASPRSVTPKTILSWEEMRAQLRLIRARGWAVDDEENELGIRCIAVALPSHSGEAEAAFSISGPTARMSDARIEELAKRCLAVQREILHGAR